MLIRQRGGLATCSTIAVAIAAVALLGCAESNSVRARGTVNLHYDTEALLADPGRYARGSTCPYGEGTRMVVSNAEGKTVKTVDLTDGEHDTVQCVFEFDVSLPESDFYEFQVDGDNTSAETFSQSEVAAGVEIDAF